MFFEYSALPKRDGHFFKKEVHDRYTLTFISDSYFECFMCGLVFSDEHYLNQHNLRCKDQRQSKHFCYTCHKGFSRNDTLNKHLSIVHLKMRDHQCEHCGKKFGEKGHLTQHIHEQHSATPPAFTCDVCGHEFNKKGNLTRHMLIHKEEYPFKCRYCGKQFNNASNLRQHIKLHIPSLADEYPCQVCGKVFNWKQKMTRHMRVHTGVKPFECEVCQVIIIITIILIGT